MISVRVKIAAAFSLFTAVLLLVLNTYPVLVTRDIVIARTRSALQSQGSVISSSLSALDQLTAESVGQVLALLDVAPVTRTLVTDRDGGVLYDTDESGSAAVRDGLLSAMAEVMEGSACFSCAYSYADGVFTSQAATPVVSGGVITGAVYLYEYDTEQGGIVTGLRRNLMNMSALFGGAGLALIVLLSTTLTRRIKRLSAAMDLVRGGDYSQRVPVSGGDELAELSEEFNILTGRLESTEEARRRFVSDASHELRTPLAAIRLLSDSIAQSGDMDEDTMREFARDIGSEADRLQRITEKLMTLTKLDSGAVTSPREAVDMAAVAERTLHLLEPLAAAQDVTLRTDLAPGCVVTASADDMYQIIFNLAENGVKYNVPGGSVRLSLASKEGRAVLSVADTGIGIPEADRDHIFERFYRVDKARSRASGGSGLGLAIVHDAVVANGGTISVAPGPERGTVFTVSFPLAAEPRQNTENPSEKENV